MANYQATLRGLTIGDGTSYEWTSMPDGFGFDGLRTSRLIVQGMDGALVQGRDLLKSRMITFEVELWGGATGTSQVESLADDLKAAWAPVSEGVLPLTVQFEGVARRLYGRPVSCVLDLKPLAVSYTRAAARLVFEAADPNLYADSLSSIVLGLTVGGGMTFPLTFPLTFGAGSDSDGSADNIGNTSAPWVATIVGPVTTPRLTLGATGEFVELDGIVPTGSTLVVDSAAQSILLDGSPRPQWQTLLSRWWSLAAGVNTVRFRAASGTGTCTFAWRSAWL